jgi:hypothetical protein
MTKKEIIEKIERQAGYIDAVDALCLISVFTDEFGIVMTKMDKEDELTWMYMKLKGYKEKDKTKSANFFERNKSKICRGCKIEKKHYEFKSYYYKDVKTRKSTCMDCDAKYKDFSDNWQKSIEEKIKKMK